ncbi:50S ribosomal protein L2 [Streptomyces caniscabiei]|uniref:50S ribosomal protein L2 n=1 Tax=Streptomyces caniscabiei TaxID=2746961 RepID=UPI0029B5F08F|nr:50S ribosomal protein L2 [Streptomyces caniscabiei]MDX2775925.1 50S ribosomal protein L2 [Streptomyces caniscabiei]
MPIKAYNPTTPARRGMTTEDYSEITTKKPLKSLLKSKKQNAGRNNTGRITVRHRGGGVKRHYRLVNHKLAAGLTVTVEEIEYDPNRSARIARVKDQHGLYHYILADTSMTKGKVIVSGEDAPIESSNRMPLAKIPVGSQIYAIEIHPGKGAQMVRSAGTKAQLMAKEGDYAQVRLPSGEVRRFRLEATAALGVVGNIQHQNVKIGSAGRNRRKGIRPSVRGVVMNAVDHPHGGGDGGSHGVGRTPKTPWGQLTLGYRTRRRKDVSKLIVKSRHDAKRKR